MNKTIRKYFQVYTYFLTYPTRRLRVFIALIHLVRFPKRNRLHTLPQLYASGNARISVIRGT